MADNYQLSRDRAQAYFLNFDQQTLIDTWQLAHDADWLYAELLGKPYRICRKTGSVIRGDGSEAGFEEALSIFDLLCHEGTEKFCTGHFAPVNSLRGCPAVTVGTDFHSETAGRLDRNWDAFQSACLELGGTPVPLGDFGFSFPVFDELTVQLKFYHADEDFPASLVLLWEENTLQYIYYETVFYIAGFLLQSILMQMGKIRTAKEETT